MYIIYIYTHIIIYIWYWILTLIIIDPWILRGLQEISSFPNDVRTQTKSSGSLNRSFKEPRNMWGFCGMKKTDDLPHNSSALVSIQRFCMILMTCLGMPKTTPSHLNCQRVVCSVICNPENGNIWVMLDHHLKIFQPNIAIRCCKCWAKKHHQPPAGIPGCLSLHP